MADNFLDQDLAGEAKKLIENIKPILKMMKLLKILLLKNNLLKKCISCFSNIYLDTICSEVLILASIYNISRINSTRW